MLENKIIWNDQNLKIGSSGSILDDLFLDPFKDGNTEIAHLIYDYVKQGKEFDQKFLIQTIQIMVKDRNLEDYIQNIHFNFSDEFASASYDKGDMRIHLFMKMLASDFKKASYYMEGMEQKFFSYCVLIFSLAHEIEHGNQVRIMKEGDDIESKILKVSESYTKRFQEKKDNTKNFISKITEEYKYYRYYQLYYRNHNYAPEERLANIYGVYLILDLIEKLEQESGIKLKQLNTKFINRFHSFLFFGYDKIHQYNPTDYYFKILKLQKEYLSIMMEADHLSILEKLIMGIYLSPLELETLNEQPNQLLKKVHHFYSKK